ncbi:TPA: hypothetical protein ACG3KG_003114 [Clostridioides difficile]
MKYEEYEIVSKRAEEFGKILEHKKGVERVLEKLDSDDYNIQIKLDFGDCSSYKLNLSSDAGKEHFIKKEMYCAFRNIKNKFEEMMEEI